MYQEGGARGLSSIENSIDALIQQPEDYIEKHEGGLFTATWNNTDNSNTSRTTIIRKQKWEEKQLHGCFKRLISNISRKKTWKWLRKETLREKVNLS